MRKFIYGVVASTTILLASCANKQSSNQYTINGQLDGLADSTVLVLTPVSHEPERDLAEAIVIGGKFVFTDTISDSRAVYLRVKDSYGGEPLMVAPGVTNITGKAEMSVASDGTPSYTMNDFKVTGSPLTDKYHSLLSTRKVLDEQYAANRKKFESVHNAMNEAYQANDEKKIEEVKNSDEYKAMLDADKAFFDNVTNTYNKVFEDNKETFWGPLMLISFTSYLTDDNRATYDSFSQEAKDSYYGRKVKDELYPVGKEGSSVTNFTVTDKDGKAFTLPELTQGKKYILIDFWASWCVPCRKSIPLLKELYAKYSDKGFEIVSISIDRKREQWEQALEEEQMAWPNFLDNGEVAMLYKIKAVPTMYLIDSNGILVGENLHGEALSEKIAELFK